MSVGSMCRRPARTASPRDTAQSAARRMGAERVGALVLVERERPVGIVTDRDLALRVVGEGHAASSIRVKEVATPSPAVLGEEASLQQAAQEMRAAPARRIPVVDDRGHVVGILAADDLVRLAARELSALAEVASEQSPRGRPVAAKGLDAVREANHYAKPVETVGLEVPVRAVAERMRSKQIGCVIVVDDSGLPSGIVTDRDLTRRVVGEDRDPNTTAVVEVMSRSLLCLDAGEPLQRVVEAMSEIGVRRIPVLRDGALAGIVTYDDVLVALGSELHALGESARSAIVG